MIENLPVGLSEAMVCWFMEKYQVSQDSAIGSLCAFLKGEGQPSAELFKAFPELSQLYFSAFNAAVVPPVVEEVVAEVVPVPVDEVLAEPVVASVEVPVVSDVSSEAPAAELPMDSTV